MAFPQSLLPITTAYFRYHQRLPLLVYESSHADDVGNRAYLFPKIKKKQIGKLSAEFETVRKS